MSSTDLPVTPGAPQTNLKGKENGFVLKLNASGSGVLFGTYLDGGAASPAIDGAGNFVMKYNPGGHLLYSTYFHGGNPSATYISAIAVDSAGNAYVTGSHTGGSLLTTPGAFETSPNPKYEVSRALPGEY
ncbi:MAG: hypothetical protein DMG57_14160 [Acidobacteria bacterium]|nr:MAG: hypothetical protein DMG57_14160 [Acidobacteriota bacterium]